MKNNPPQFDNFTSFLKIVDRVRGVNKYENANYFKYVIVL